jgi:hypothetical protein
MGLVYVYLVAWVAGGVALGAGMLLEQRAELQAEGPAERAASLSSLFTFVLIGFGVTGLLLEGFGLMRGQRALVGALAAGLVLGILGYGLRRASQRGDKARPAPTSRSA